MSKNLNRRIHPIAEVYGLSPKIIVKIYKKKAKIVITTTFALKKFNFMKCNYSSLVQVIRKSVEFHNPTPLKKSI